MDDPKAPPPADLQALLDHRPFSRRQWQVALLCAAAVFFDGYDLQVMALAVPALAREWQIAPTQFGWALAAMVAGVTAGAAFLAPLSDRFGRRPALIAALALVGLATLASTTASSPGQFVLWRLLTGLGLGVCIPVCNAWTAEYTPLRRRGLVLVLMNSAIGIGAFSAGLLVPGLIEASGWRAAFYLGGVAPLVIAGLVGLVGLGAPESLKFLLARRPQDPRIPGLLTQLLPGTDPATLAAACLLLFLAVPIGAGWFVLLALIGLGSAGTQLALNALSTAYYPPAIKATGMGWAGVMSGWGSMAAPLAGAWLLQQGLPPTQVLAWIAVPVLLCAAGTWCMRQDWQRH